MIYKMVIHGRLPDINEYTSANRSSPFKGARMKQSAQSIVEASVHMYLRGVKINKPVRIHYTFYEKNRRRDHDNVSGFAHKVVQDALVSAGVLVNDGWKEVLGDENNFDVSASEPRIEVLIEEVD